MSTPPPSTPTGYLVRQIALKSNGEEIVRASQVAGDELTIGRDSSCAIHLPDLAVDPLHARIRKIDDGHLMIESIGEQPFDVNGRSVNRRELSITAGAELGFGGHRIKLDRDAETGLPAFTVRRVEAVSDSAEDKDAGTVYTLKGLLPGKRMSAWTFAILVLVAFLALPIWSYATYQPLALHKDARRPAGFHADQTWSSGHLSLAHKNLNNNCQACHTKAFVAVRDNACLSCHTQDAHQHIADGGRLLRARGNPEGFAAFQRAVATMFNRPAGRCVDCHTEHEGAGAMPATQQQFCTTCHDGLKSRLPDTRIADAADFGTAHPEFRPTIIVDPTGEKPLLQRVAWSEGLRENDGLKFTHAAHLSKVNGIAQMVHRRADMYGGRSSLECKDCHQVDPSGTWYEPVKMEKSCQTCHSLTFDQVGGTFRTLRHGEPAMVVADLRAYYRSAGPVRPANLSGLARRVPGDAALQSTAADYARAVRFYPTRADQAVAQVFSKGGMCYDCHTVIPGGAASTGGFTVQKVAQNNRYYHTGWFNHKDHTKTDCAFCHAKAETSNDASDLMIPGMNGKGGCRSCHVGESGTHLASVSVKDPVDSGCAMCHSYHMDSGAPWQPKDKRNAAVHRADADRPRLPGEAALR
ncbi:cytochrome c3 family protein [Novosphingobium lentum]|uniref:cytochrome c3 family protein n=1 Tax=Novosphingobium lentum TaxID=145287 RepID=UPI000835761A|nr:cytochrome c3 family protein [Novosphingobium lentum]